MKNSKIFWTSYNSQSAFTLIELIIAVAIVALIAAATFVSIDPAQRLGDAKDAIRASDAVAIEKAVQKAIAEGAAVPIEMAALSENVPYMLVTEGAATSGACNCNTLDESIARIDIAGEFEAYMGSDMPVDDEATGDDSGYYITRKGNSFSVASCNAHGDEFVDTSCPSRNFCPDMTSNIGHGIEDGQVDFEDLMYISLGFGTCHETDPETFALYYKADFNNDCCIDALDNDCYGDYHGQAVDCGTFSGSCPN